MTSKTFDGFPALQAQTQSRHKVDEFPLRLGAALLLQSARGPRRMPRLGLRGRKYLIAQCGKTLRAPSSEYEKKASGIVFEGRIYGKFSRRVGLTVEPALVLAETRPQERLVRRLREVVENGGHGRDDDRHTPGVDLVDTQSNQLLALLHRCGSEITGNTQKQER